MAFRLPNQNRKLPRLRITCCSLLCFHKLRYPTSSMSLVSMVLSRISRLTYINTKCSILFPLCTCSGAPFVIFFPLGNLSSYIFGVKLTSSVDKIFAAPFPPMLCALTADLVRWHTGSYTWMGQNASLKIIMPRLLYFFQIIFLPIVVPTTF